MADRLFATLLLLVSIAYGVIAFVAISAPFQYDPLGPESWPRILSVLVCICLVLVILRPRSGGLDVAAGTWARLGLMALLLFGYAQLYQPLGFILATFVFATLVSAMLGAGLLRAVAFGVASGVLGHLVCSELLDLNVPDGILIETLLRITTSPEPG